MTVDELRTYIQGKLAELPPENWEDAYEVADGIREGKREAYREILGLLADPDPV